MKNLSVYKALIIVFPLLLFSCRSGVETSDGMDFRVPSYEPSLNAVLYQQHSAEYKAICLQTYSYAQRELERMMPLIKSRLPLTIVSDLDETVLDNSPYNAQLILDGEDYTPETWKKWVEKKNAKAVPGAIEFFEWAKSQGLEIFYISNRTEDLIEPTIKNMKALGLPNADIEHVLLKTNSSDKGSRFNSVNKNHHVIMKLGDNLEDFDTDMIIKTGTERTEFLDVLEKGLGSSFVVFPNPMYGSWEGKGLFEGLKNLTQKQKDSIKVAKLNGWR
ncbi:MAG: hypothetical protein Kapaf2KO_00980 [Candidatus Kapaibacteriales bacterium]